MPRLGLLLFLALPILVADPGAHALPAPHAIINGTAAAPHAFPAMVSLRWEGKHKCGGTLISPRLVLTAAHCISLVFRQPGEDAKVSVVIGSNNWETPDSGAVVAKVNGFEFHPGIPEEARHWGWWLQTSPYTVSTDLAVIRLASSVSRHPPAIDFATLASTSGPKPAVGDRCSAVGWGRSENDPADWNTMKDIITESFPTALQVGEMEVTQNADCHGSNGDVITENKMCMKEAFRGGRGLGMICFGDSGSPLFCRDNNGAMYVAGVTMAGKVPCTLNHGEPAIYTRVAVGRSFIDEKMRESA